MKPQHNEKSARGFGRFQYRAGKPLHKAIRAAREDGMAEELIKYVQEGWSAERDDMSQG